MFYYVYIAVSHSLMRTDAKVAKLARESKPALGDKRTTYWPLFPPSPQNSFGACLVFAEQKACGGMFINLLRYSFLPARYS
jgi:hypothetical protein